MATAKNRSVEPGHRIAAGEAKGAEAESKTALDILGEHEQGSLYRDDMAPLAAGDPEVGKGGDIGGRNETRLVVLRKGGSYHLAGKVFRKGEPSPVEPEVAQKLLNTGMFEWAEG